MKIRLLIAILYSSLVALLFTGNLVAQTKEKQQSQKQYDVAAFLYPAYASDDPRLRSFWPKGIGEWETVENMQTRYPGHAWNRKSKWGSINEADPNIMEMEINTATKHGVNVFIFDWYWYDGRPFMETTLDNGFLKASNNDKMKFYLMWANHSVDNTWDTRINKLGDQNTIFQGTVGRFEFEKICKRTIEKYFRQPQYYKIDGKPVYMIYDLKNLIDGLGGVDQTADALNWFRQETKKAGFPGLDLQFAMWLPNLNYSGMDANKTTNPQNDFINKLGFTSTTHYQFCHFTDMNRDYLDILKDVKKEWSRIDSVFDIPYYPHISIGWDNSPRMGTSPVTKNNTPDNFETALRMAKDYVDAHPKQAPLITINSWNEWTETSYLMPDNVNGYGYLEAVKKVFYPKK